MLNPYTYLSISACEALILSKATVFSKVLEEVLDFLLFDTRRHRLTKIRSTLQTYLFTKLVL
jgi:hypothetical protein